ncbi:ESX secretion-associated protein EspG [Rhodococcus sp. SRB_17]|nr:ESX secretion-associated protein EspG [Rhodococcus sp. SRB_17]
MIDLGISTSTDALPPISVTAAEIEYTREQLGLDVLPIALGGTARARSTAEREASMRRAAMSLSERGLLPDGEIHHDLGSRLQVLTRPSWELAVRSQGPGAITRACIAADESFCVEATYNAVEGMFTLGSIDSGPVDSIARTVGPSNAMPIAVINAPTQALAGAFDAAPDTESVVSALLQGGVPATEAGQLGRAITTCTAFYEIAGIPHVLDSAHSPVGIVTVYDTAFGRLVSSLSTSADGTDWSSISSGTPTRLRQAVNMLVANLESCLATSPR